MKNGSARETRAALEQLFPNATCALHHRSAFELLIATILSAQCTDERVNKVTPILFERYPTPEAMAGATIESLEEIVHSLGFFRSKAKSIQGVAERLCRRHSGQVPASMADLVDLPGVARKTANVVLGTWFRVASGIVVDTHVARVSRRLGLTTEESPEKIERELMGLLPERDWIAFGHRMIQHGRVTCRARKPSCERCKMASFCPSAGMTD